MVGDVLVIRKDKHKFADGSYKTQIRVTEGYRDSVTGNPKQKTIKSFGYLEDQVDPVSFMEKVKEFDLNFKRDKKVVVYETKTKPFYEDDSSDLRNFGYRFIETIYDYLEIDKVLNNIEYKGSHLLSEIFKFLVIQRIMNPDSKRATYQQINDFYLKNYSFGLAELYRSLDFFAENSDKIQAHLNEIIKSKIGRNTAEFLIPRTSFFKRITKMKMNMKRFYH